MVLKSSTGSRLFSRLNSTSNTQGGRLASDRSRLLSAVFEYDDDPALEDDRPQRASDRCGVVGVSASENCSLYLYYALRALQQSRKPSEGLTTLPLCHTN